MKAIVKAMCMVFCVVTLLSACGSKIQPEDYAGTYIGQSNSTLVLNDNGTCKYMQPNWPTLSGKWRIEDQQIIVSGALDYSIYADIDGSDSTLLFQSNDLRWKDEVFVKLS